MQDPARTLWRISPYVKTSPRFVGNVAFPIGALRYEVDGITTSDSNWVSTTQTTMCCWIKHPRAINASATPRIIDGTRLRILQSGGGTGGRDINYQRDYITTDGEWFVNIIDAGFSPSEWLFLAITHDTSSDANDPVFYMAQEGQSVLQTPTVTQVGGDPAGGPNNTTTTFYVGNIPSPLRPYEGDIAWAQVYNTVLSVPQIYDVAQFGYISTNLIRGYHLTQHTGAGAEQDLSTNNVDATSTGFVTPVPGPQLMQIPIEQRMRNTTVLQAVTTGAYW